ncbi:MAG: hypothetical protein CTY32_08570 [Methylotenera sp.]|jgi:hypothetical protein|nr:MAG: hypothetical protein CTY32_08570 [Methylotenera sp.]
MALNNFSTESSVVVINGRQITDWGDTDPPFSDEPIDPKSVLRRGLGGNAVRLDRINPGRRFTLNLNPGSPDSSYMQGLFNSNANITMSYTQIGTLEVGVGAEGVIVNDGTRGRGGQTITDNQFIIEFNSWTGSK